MNIESLVSIASIGAFLVTLISIAFSARKYLQQKETDQRSQRFITYHGLVHAISSGTSPNGVMAITSQIAYLYELRNYPEYSALTYTVLEKLKQLWRDNESPEKYAPLKEAIDDTLAALK